MKQKRMLLPLLISIVGIAVIGLYPIHSKFLNLSFLASIALLWLSASALFWHQPWLRIGLLLIPVLASIPCILPGSAIDSSAVHENYLRRLASFEGSDYVWGGESSRGIDCSGLPRRAYRDALLANGLKTLNGRAFRHYAEQWWFDASAKALGEGYRKYTRPLTLSGTIQTLDTASLQTGDLAITTDGVHALAYMGNDHWIQAEPGIKRVVTLNGKTNPNPWFRLPVSIHRWTLLD